MITSLYAAILALIYVFLSVRIIGLRRSLRISIGDGNNPMVTRAIRMHGNFSEYVPLALILMFLIESISDYRRLVEVLGIVLVVGRVSHAYGLRTAEADFRLRVGGMAMTFSVLIISSCVLIWLKASSLQN